MQTSYENDLWNACVINAIHCSISSMDALTVYHLGLRHSGRKHDDANNLLKQIGLEQKVIRTRSKQYSQLLSVKTLAEYEGRLMDKKDAENAKKNCDRIITWVKENLE